jgi:peptidoglycan/LPS O-acetylase OafA/YrhL
MSSTESVLSVGSPARNRDRYLDTLRALALVRVVAYHAFGTVWLKWFPSMGIMFALGGLLMVRSLDRSAPATVVGNRCRRLLPVLWLFAAFWVPVMIRHDGPPSAWHVPAWQLAFWVIPVGNPPGSAGGVFGWGPLWYIKAYLCFVLLSPLLLPVFRKLPWVVLAAPFALLALAELNVIPLAGWWGQSIGDVLTYLGCWLVGFAHAEGMLRRISLPSLVAIGAAAAVAGVAWLLGPGNDGKPTWSLLDSDLAIGLYYFGLVLVLMRFSFEMNWLRRVPLLDRAITVFNARAVTIFVWHGVAIALALEIYARSGLGAAHTWFLVAWLLIGVAVLLFGWIEDLAARRRPALVPKRQELTRPRRGPA